MLRWFNLMVRVDIMHNFIDTSAMKIIALFIFISIHNLYFVLHNRDPDNNELLYQILS